MTRVTTRLIQYNKIVLSCAIPVDKYVYVWKVKEFFDAWFVCVEIV